MKTMPKSQRLIWSATACLVLATLVLTVMPSNGSENPNDKVRKVEKLVVNHPADVTEARDRARLLHETIHGTLLVVHRDFYREDEGLPIPSRSMKYVFNKLERQWDVKIEWLAVNAQAMDVDHEPRDQFEKKAVVALSKGKLEFEGVEKGRYRHVGTIRLSSECLKCHLPNRRSNEDRAAGLVISMPLKTK